MTRLCRLSPVGRALFACALLGIASVAPSASAAGNGATAPARKAAGKTAKKLVAEGERALAAKDYATALGRFRAADDAQSSPVARLGEARAMVGLGQLAAAEQMYISVLKDDKGRPLAHPPPGAVKEEAALALQLPYVTVTVTGADAAVVTVSIDGEALPGTSWKTQHPVDPGSHFARAEAPGLETVETPFTAVEGSAQTVALTFHGAAPTSQTTTSVSANSDKDDGPSSGGHTRRTVGWGLVIGGAAGLVFGGVTGVIALSKHSSLETTCPGGVCPASAASSLSSYHTMGTLSTIGLIAGGAVAATGLVLVIIPTKDPPKDAPTPAPKEATSGTPGDAHGELAGSARSGLRLAPVIAPGLVGTAAEWTF